MLQKGYQTRFSIWETNTGTLHDMQRALNEALDINEYDRNAEVGLQRCGSFWPPCCHAGADRPLPPPEQSVRLDSRTASFCVEAAGHDDLWADQHGDQGLIFCPLLRTRAWRAAGMARFDWIFGTVARAVAPNQTWAQPPYYTHQMIAASSQDYVVAVNVSEPTVDVAALASADGSNTTVRIVNANSVTVVVMLTLVGPTRSGCQAQVTALVAPNMDASAANPATDPFRVVPVRSALPFASGDVLAVAPLSFTTVQVSCME
jgi:hypothetical protein